MMHDQEKLSRLFDAALQEEDAPQPQTSQTRPIQAWQFVRPGDATEPVSAVTETAEPVSAFRFVRPEASPATSEPGDRGSSEEFAKILDEKILLRNRRNRRSFLVTLILFSAGTLGGAGWFVSNPARVTAFKAAFSEIRSATDIGAIRAKYQKSLDKIAERRNHVNDAAAMVGVDPDSTTGNDDPYLNKEMREMMGPDGGPTLGERNQALGNKAEELKKAGIIKDETPVPTAKQEL